MAELLEETVGHEIPAVVSVLSSILEKITEGNDAADAAAAACSGRGQHQLLPYHHHLGCVGGGTAFHGLTKPSISVRSYLERIFRYANCSGSCYVVAYIYLDRFVQRNQAVFIDSFNVHRLLITCVLAAVKFMEDIYYNNAYFAKVGGISLMEMNYLEVVFLFGVGFELNVTPSVFNSYYIILQRQMYLESPPASIPRVHCYLTEEESGSSSSCQQKQQQQQQLAV